MRFTKRDLMWTFVYIALGFIAWSLFWSELFELSGAERHGERFVWLCVAPLYFAIVSAIGAIVMMVLGALKKEGDSVADQVKIIRRR